MSLRNRPPPLSCYCSRARAWIAFGIHPIHLEILRPHVWGPGTTMDNTDGRAAVLWRLRARQSVATCVLELLPVGALLTLRQDDEVVFRETFPDAHLAETRAERLRERLEAKGWTAVPMEDTESRRQRA